MEVINDTSFGGEIGKALGGGVRELAQLKLQSLQEPYQRMLQQQQFVQGAEKIFGKEGAQFLSTLSPDLQKAVFQNPVSYLKLLNAGGLPGLGAQQGGGMQQLMQGQQGQIPLPGGQPASQPGQEIPNTGVLSPALLEQIRNQQGQQPQKAQDDIGKLLEDIFTSPHEKREKEKLDLKKTMAEHTFNKDAREYLAPYEEKANASRNNIRDYNQIIKLAEKGNLRAGNKQQLLSKVGLAEFGRNFDTQVADKIMARLGQNVGSAFGTGRLTNFLEQTFQRSLPSLWNTPEGIVAIAKLNKLSDEAELVKHETRQDIIGRNGGRIPYDIEARVHSATQDRVNKLENQALDALSAASTGYKAGQRFSSLPNASSVPEGTVIKNKRTGKSVVSDGKSWKDVA